MSEHTILLFNEKAEKVKELFENPDLCLKKIFNNVYSVLIKNKEIDIIVKCYDKKYYAVKEINNLKKIQHKSVPKILAYGIGKKLKYVIMSKIKGKDFCDHMKLKNFTEDEIKNISKQLLNILKELHEKNIIHCDIKPENIIYNDKTGKVSLIDFEGKSTTGYSSPEQIKGYTITNKTDLWSLGVTLYTIFTKSVLFKTKKQTLEKNIEFSDDFASYEFIDFLQCLIQRNVCLRYDVYDAMEHIWLQ